MALQDKILEGGKLIRTLFHYHWTGIRPRGFLALFLSLITQTGSDEIYKTRALALAAALQSVTCIKASLRN